MWIGTAPSKRNKPHLSDAAFILAFDFGMRERP
jgi:hypothetical protein